MKICILVMILISVPDSLATGEDSVSNAMIIIERYFSMRSQDSEDIGKAGRLLAELKEMPNGAVAAAEKVLFERANSRQRRAIVGALGDHIHTTECAQLLYRVLKDVRESKSNERWEELLRSSAVHGLRKMARRTNRSGAFRTGPDFEPQVKGILPYLIFATNDKSEMVRVNALYGLADSRDPAAVPELRKCLNDPSWKIRLLAACFLTEYQDTSGLSEMCKGAKQLQQKPTDVIESLEYYQNIELTLASFERITRKSFGDIPRNPLISSDSNAEANASRIYKEFLNEWELWCKEKAPLSPVLKP